MKHLTDQELMRIIQAGDHSPASELYDRYAPRMYNFALRHVRNAETAEDITQEVFIRMITRAHQFKADSSLATWLFAITLNTSRDHLRKKQKHGEEQSDDVLVSAPASDEDGPEWRYEQGEFARNVKEALDDLNEDVRQAIILARYEELPYSEIAKVVGCSEGAVKSRIFRGLESMRKRLSKPAVKTAPEKTNV
jgi:RNA polymerase sigma factor (sigma-70 family)